MFGRRSARAGARRRALAIFAATCFAELGRVNLARVRAVSFVVCVCVGMHARQSELLADAVRVRVWEHVSMCGSRRVCLFWVPISVRHAVFVWVSVRVWVCVYITVRCACAKIFTFSPLCTGSIQLLGRRIIGLPLNVASTETKRDCENDA